MICFMAHTLFLLILYIILYKNIELMVFILEVICLKLTYIIFINYKKLYIPRIYNKNKVY